MSSVQREYVASLLGQGDASICPSCYRQGRRKRFCTNAVVLQEDGVKLVCCWIGDKNEISAEAFETKLREMREQTT